MKGGVFGGVGLFILGALALIGYLTVYIVDPREQALILRLGEPVAVKSDPGIYFKLPLIENAVFIERRLIDLDSPPLEVIARDQKRLVVDAFGRFKIVDPLRFYQTVGNVLIAEQRLSLVLNSAVRGVLGEVPFIDVVKDQRAALMQKITDQVNANAKSFGIDVVDVRIRRADLPEANSQAIYQRMQTERQRDAADARARGEQAARGIRAAADREVTVIVADANKESEQKRGEGEATVSKIYADAFNADPEFFAFYRSMQAYQAGLRADDTRLFVSPDSKFFDYFANPKGRAAAPAAGAARTGASGTAAPAQ